MLVIGDGEDGRRHGGEVYRSQPERGLLIDTALLIDTDNAAGSPSGDVDDAFAIAALLRSGLPVAAVASVGGNTGEAAADRNNRALGEICGYPGPYLRGVQAGG